MKLFIKSSLYLFLSVSFVLPLSAASWPPPAPAGAGEQSTEKTGTFAMRGFGKVEAEGFSWKTPQGLASIVRLNCENPEKAKITASKYLADMLAFGAVKKIDGQETLLEVRYGGVWRIGFDGASVFVAAAPNRAALAAAVKNWGADNWQKVPELAYPRWLDNFDNAGLGIWITPKARTPEQLEWFKKFPAVANMHRQSLDMSPAPGVYDTSASDYGISYVKALGKTYRYMVWCGMGDSAWFDWMQIPGEQVEQFMPGYLGNSFFRLVYYRHQDSTDLVNYLMLDSQLAMLRKAARDPDLLAYMEPHGEMSVKDGFMPQNARERFREFLRDEKKYSLEQVSTAYTGSKDGFKSWDDVVFPDDAWFAGRRESFLDLDDVAWRFKAEAQEPGCKAGFEKRDFNDSSWYQSLRYDIRMMSAWDGNSRIYPLWMRFKHEVPAEFLKGNEKTYLHIMPFLERDGRKLSIWINGREVAQNLHQSTGPVYTHAVCDVSDFLRPGENHFAIYSNGGRLAYRVFLGKIPKQEFPYADKRLNRQYVDRQDFFISSKFKMLETFVKAIRSIDPDRPIKSMTPGSYQDRAMELFDRFGGYPQLTGEGAFYRPMHYKGYSRLRGLPGSSEPGGPSTEAPGLQRMFAYIFYESQDAHDYMTDLDIVYNEPEARKYWTDNTQLLSTLGKTDFIEPKLGVLRDTRQGYRYNEDAIWNWDLSRGPLPALGISPVLVGGGEFENGHADKLPVIFDCSTVITDKPMIEAVKKYVQNGGTFLAMHNSGQNTPESRDTWNLASEFGLKVTPKLIKGDDVNKWPVAKISFTDKQTLFPSLRGKVFEGSGVSIDWEGVEKNGAVAIHGEKCTPIAHWDDDKSIAIAEVNYGKGRFIMLGSPFFLRFKDTSGKWINEQDRQKLVAELLGSLGMKLDTAVTDPRVWLERRESKNGLYDVYLACAMGWKEKDFKMTEQLDSVLTALRAKATPAIETSATGIPDIATTFADGKLSFGKQIFSPYQTRQFAVVRDDAGLHGPMHWLNVQRNAWRALEKVPEDYVKKAADARKKYAAEIGEDGLDLNSGWKVKVDPYDTSDAWLSENTADWKTADMGEWSVQGLKNAKRVFYRKRVDVPKEWNGGRIILGLFAWRQAGVFDSANIWVNGNTMASKLKGQFQLDPSEAAKKGFLDMAMEVTSDPKPDKMNGPVGTVYLHKFPKPRAVMDLAGQWDVTDGWLQNPSRKAELPGKGKAFSLRRTIVIPEEWKGRPVRLQIDIPDDKISGIIVNDDGLILCGCFNPLGPRIDRWFKVGKENVIELYGKITSRDSGKDSMINYDIKSIKLEVY
jgi:hypothetical protein